MRFPSRGARFPNHCTKRLCSFQFFEVARPIVLEQARQRTVGENLAPGLAARAVVRLIVGVDDALNRRSADRTRLAESAMRCHLGPEGGHFLRKAGAYVLAQALGPVAERFLHSLVKPGDLVTAQALR